MTELVVSTVEVNRIKSSMEPVAVKGPDGEFLGFITPPRIPDDFDRLMIEQIKAHRHEPQIYHSFDQVKERLRQLDAHECPGK